MTARDLGIPGTGRNTLSGVSGASLGTPGEEPMENAEALAAAGETCLAPTLPASVAPSEGALHQVQGRSFALASRSPSPPLRSSAPSAVSLSAPSAPSPRAPRDSAISAFPVTPPVRLGVIDYLNAAPVYHWLRHQTMDESTMSPGVCLSDDGVALVAGVPSAMNAALVAGAIDVSNVSSVAFGQHAREWLLLPDLSVAAHGRVASVLLFSRHRDWSALDGGSIAVTSDSATSVALVKLLCARRYGVSPRFVAQPPDLDAMLAAHDAALLIGDIALREGQARRPIGGAVPYVFDLAAEWQAWMGLPFVFSVWAARRDHAEAIRAGGVLDLLRASKRWGLAHLDAIADDAARRLNLPPATCDAYLRLLDYDLDERDQRGLRAFLELALPDFAWEDVRWL